VTRRRMLAKLALCALLFGVSFSAEAQHQVRVSKIGWLAARPPSGAASGIELFRVEMHKLGYVEGKQFVFEYRSAENKIERLPTLAEELVRIKVDVLIASSTAEAAAAKTPLRQFRSCLHW